MWSSTFPPQFLCGNNNNNNNNNNKAAARPTCGNRRADEVTASCAATAAPFKKIATPPAAEMGTQLTPGQQLLDATGTNLDQRFGQHLGHAPGPSCLERRAHFNSAQNTSYGRPGPAPGLSSRAGVRTFDGGAAVRSTTTRRRSHLAAEMGSCGIRRTVRGTPALPAH